MTFSANVLEMMKEITPRLNARLCEQYRPYGLTYVQFLVLMEVSRSDGMKLTDLSDRLGMGKSNLSPLCRRLEDRGFLIRKRDHMDHRIIHLSLTPKSREMIAAVRSYSDHSSILELSHQEEESILQALTLLRKKV